MSIIDRHQTGIGIRLGRHTFACTDIECKGCIAAISLERGNDEWQPSRWCQYPCGVPRLYHDYYDCATIRACLPEALKDASDAVILVAQWQEGTNPQPLQQATDGALTALAAAFGALCVGRWTTAVTRTRTLSAKSRRSCSKHGVRWQPRKTTGPLTNSQSFLCIFCIDAAGVFAWCLRQRLLSLRRVLTLADG